MSDQNPSTVPDPATAPDGGGNTSAGQPFDDVSAPAAYGQSPYGQPPYGQSPYGQPPYPGQVPAAGYPPAGSYPVAYGKSKIAAGLLGIFLGMFGVHNFYLGFTGKAVAQLLITLLSLGFLWFVSAIWGLIEGILILVAQPGTPSAYDANGVPLTQ